MIAIENSNNFMNKYKKKIFTQFLAARPTFPLHQRHFVFSNLLHILHKLTYLDRKSARRKKGRECAFEKRAAGDIIRES